MRRLCGRSSIAATPVSGERERKQRGGTGFRCIVAHEGERSSAQGGASVRAVRKCMQYVRQADTSAWAPRPGGRMRQRTKGASSMGVRRSAVEDAPDEPRRQ
jgi:hypothetical protein